MHAPNTETICLALISDRYGLHGVSHFGWGRGIVWLERRVQATGPMFEVFSKYKTCLMFSFFSPQKSAVELESDCQTLERRIEDKLNGMGMEFKTVQIMFDTASIHGNRRA